MLLNNNVEIIVIDDGSNDKTKKVLKKIEPKVNLLITQENKGQSTARNKGIKMAKGQFILTLDSDDFADGEQINIDEYANFFKIISEGAGKLGVLLKTAKIEESTYLDSTKSTETIHAPPIVTGSTEAAVRVVTDITGVVILVYDISVDAETRQQTWQGLKQVKDQIAENPTTLFPLLKDIIVEHSSV